MQKVQMNLTRREFVDLLVNLVPEDCYPVVKNALQDILDENLVMTFSLDVVRDLFEKEIFALISQGRMPGIFEENLKNPGVWVSVDDLIDSRMKGEIGLVDLAARSISEKFANKILKPIEERAIALLGTAPDGRYRVEFQEPLPF